MPRPWSLECGQACNSTKEIEPLDHHSWISQSICLAWPRFFPVHLGSLWYFAVVNEFRKGCGATGVGWENIHVQSEGKTCLRGDLN